MFRRRFSGRAYVAAWKVWLPVLAMLVGLEVSFDSWFWKIPKISGANADFGYQFLVDAHPLRQVPAPETLRVLAFGSSVSGSFDPRQVDSLFAAADPETDFEVHRLLLPAAHPTDYVLYFGNTDLAPPQVVVILFNLVDFLFSGSDRDANPTLRYILPPLVLREQRREHMDVAGELDLLAAEASDLYRFRKPLRSALQDHVRAAGRWLRSRDTGQAYGIHADGHTERRFGFPVAAGAPFDFRYFVDPEWLLQRGVVRVRVESAGTVLAERVETRSGWQQIAIPAGAATGMLDVVLDSTWSPRVTGVEDVRLLGVRLAPELVDAAGPVGAAPFFLRPREPADIDSLLRMGGARGEEFLARWDETLEADTRFGHRFRLYRDAKRAVAERAFVVDAEYEAIGELTAHFTDLGATVILVNTPESPLMLADYGASEYYRAYREYFAQVAADHPGASFVDLSEVLPAEDFNDLHHPNFVGSIKLGPVYTDVIRAALGRLPGQAIVEEP
jgi:hypothetical protein